MKLIELEIDNLRGIQHLILKPNGNNFLVFGPNGSGKSAIVDATDFLLTGKISRMTGAGTKDIKLKEHGPHINSEPEDVHVRGVFEIEGFEGQVEIKRSMGNPKTLICNSQIKSRIKPILEMANRGQHVLTRREILNYVTAEASTRSKQIQKLLKITEVEQIRRKLVNVKNKLNEELKSAESSKINAEASIMATIGESSFDTDRLLEIINYNRHLLDGEPIFEIKSSLLTKDIKPITSSAISVNTDILESDIKNIKQLISKENKGMIKEIDGKLRDLILQINSDPKLKKATELKRLTELGLFLIDEDGNCPLCGTDWNPGDLKENLEKQLCDLKEASKVLNDILNLSNSISMQIKSLMSSIEKILDVLETLNIKDRYLVLESWQKNLEELSKCLENAIENYPYDRFGQEMVQNLLASPSIGDFLDKILDDAKSRTPESTPEQTAWETLIRLEEKIKIYQDAEIKLENAIYTYKKAEILVKSYEESMESVLGKLMTELKIALKNSI